MSIQSLRAVVVHDLYSIFRPGSNRNPFRELEQQVRNQLIFIMLLHLGLRRSELRILPVDAIKDERDLKTGALRCWSGTRR